MALGIEARKESGAVGGIDIQLEVHIGSICWYIRVIVVWISCKSSHLPTWHIFRDYALGLIAFFGGRAGLMKFRWA
jgi:hypothetical protein